MLSGALNPKPRLELRQVELIAYTEWEIVHNCRFGVRLLAHEAQNVSAVRLPEEDCRLPTPEGEHNANKSQRVKEALERFSESGVAQK